MFVLVWYVVCWVLSLYQRSKFFFDNMRHCCWFNIILEFFTAVINKYNVINKCLFWCDVWYAMCSAYNNGQNFSSITCVIVAGSILSLYSLRLLPTSIMYLINVCFGAICCMLCAKPISSVKILVRSVAILLLVQFYHWIQYGFCRKV